MRKKILLYLVFIFITIGITAIAGGEVGKIGDIDLSRKEIIVNVKSGTDLKLGDLLEVNSSNGKIIMNVIFPMQTIARCRIKGTGKLSDLNKGMTVSFYNSEGKEDGVVKRIPVKPGRMKKTGNVEMVYIKAGNFMMGSNTGDSDELPVHQVTVDGFWIGKYEVTQKQYEELMGINPSRYKDYNCPVEQVNWEDAMEFCKRFSEKYKVKARLPYEAEWEYACRAGANTRYYWGDNIEDDYCWFYINAVGSKTQPVGKKKPNGYGLYDMSGNVWEWCMDLYSINYYSESLPINPTGPQKGSDRVARGGSWADSDNNVTSSDRNGQDPEDRYYTGGFRIVVSD